MRLKTWLRDRQRILWCHTSLIALGFVLMQLLRNRPEYGPSLYFLIMTLTLPIGPLIDLLFFKIGNDWPRYASVFNILLPVLITAGTYIQWKIFIPKTIARLARVRRR